MHWPCFPGACDGGSSGDGNVTLRVSENGGGVGEGFLVEAFIEGNPVAVIRMGTGCSFT